MVMKWDLRKAGKLGSLLVSWKAVRLDLMKVCQKVDRTDDLMEFLLDQYLVEKMVDWLVSK